MTARHPIPDQALDNHIAILGKTGSGKTYTAKGIVEMLLAAGKRVCIIDPTSAYWGLRSGANGKSGGFPIVVFGGPKADVPLDKSHGKMIAEIVGTSNTPAILDTRLFTTGERTTFFSDFAEELLRKNEGTLHLVIDEAHLFAPQGRVNDPQSGRMLHAANNLVSLGRGIGLNIIMLTQRPAKLHKDSLTQVETLIAMRLVAPQDRAAVNDWIGEWADPKDAKGMMSELPSLPSGEGWIWSPLADVFKRVKFPRIETYDSSRAPQGLTGKGPTMKSINIPELETRLKTVVAETVENDPRKLKARIAELEKSVKAPAVDPEAMSRAFKSGEATGWKNAMSAVTGFVNSAKLNGSRVPDSVTDSRPARERLKDAFHFSIPKPEIKIVKTQTASGDGTLPAGEKKVLSVVAQYPEGCSREQLTIISGYKKSSRDAYVQRLRARGYVTGGGDAITVTQDGMDALGDDFEPLPTGQALRDHWLSKLPAGEARILDIVMGRYPNTATRDSVGESAGYKKSSRDAYIKRLTARKLVKSVGSGCIAASEALFS